jgi:hypothetical protein
MDYDLENDLLPKSEQKDNLRTRKTKRNTEPWKKKTAKILKAGFGSPKSEDSSPHIKKPDKMRQESQVFDPNDLYLPSTPHNTTQYLTANHCRGRSDYPVNISYNLFSDEEFKKLIMNDIINIEDICITGGTMKGVINRGYDNIVCNSEVCAERMNDLVEVINFQKTVIQNLRQQIQDVQKRML